MRLERPMTPPSAARTPPQLRWGGKSGFGVLAGELRGVRALAALFLVLQARRARPGALVLVLHVDVQRAHLLDGKLDPVAVHEGVQPAMVGAGGQDVAGL